MELHGPGAVEPPPGSAGRRMMTTAEVAHDVADPAGALARRLGPGPWGLIVVFVSAAADFGAVLKGLTARYPATPVVGCTTAGEIGSQGYTDGAIVALGLPREHFAAIPIPVPDLDRIDGQEIVSRMIRARTALVAGAPSWSHEFAFLLVDGLSLREDQLVSAIVTGLGPVPLFGGSAGDGSKFTATQVALGDRVMQHGAVLCLVRTDCAVRVFSLDHLRPTPTRMVVTRANPAKRVVHEINAEPAAREYARLLGRDPEELSAFTFAAHPVAIRLGGKHHVRSIQRVLDNGDMVFFSAIGEGLVLSLAVPEDMAAHLERELKALDRDGRAPEALWVCDCILRRVEAEERQQTHALSRILARHNAVGFSTYGEQINGLHVNQTMTGVAIYAPDGVRT